jgi:hypothetical protein
VHSARSQRAIVLGSQRAIWGKAMTRPSTIT